MIKKEKKKERKSKIYAIKKKLFTNNIMKFSFFEKKKTIIINGNDSLYL